MNNLIIFLSVFSLVLTIILFILNNKIKKYKIQKHNLQNEINKSNAQFNINNEKIYELQKIIQENVEKIELLKVNMTTTSLPKTIVKKTKNNIQNQHKNKNDLKTPIDIENKI